MRNTFHLGIALGALALASIACVVNLGGPALPDERIPVIPDAATPIQEALGIAVEEARRRDGAVALSVNEVQLTSLLASRLATQSEPFIHDPQVFLRDGQVRVYGKAQRGYFAATVGVVLSAGVDADGRPRLSVVSADFGPLPAPEGLEGMFTDLFNEAYTGALGPVATGFRLESLTIEEGTLTLSGRVR